MTRKSDTSPVTRTSSGRPASKRPRATCVHPARSGVRTQMSTLLPARVSRSAPVAAVARGREYASLRFGDPAAEVPRRRLSAEDVCAVVCRERDELRSAAEDYARLGQGDAAAAVALKAEILERYLAPA